MTTPQMNPADVEAEVVHHCVGCGYNLHGLDVIGDCPECGKPISESVELPAIWVAQPKWFERQLIALWVLVAAEFLSGLTWYSSLFFELLPAGARHSNPWMFSAVNGIVLFMFLLRYGLIIAVGWLMMRPNKISAPDSQENRWRKLVFPLSLACLVLHFNTVLWACLVLISYVINLSLDRVVKSQSYEVISYGISIVGIVVLIATGIWFAIMLYRITSNTKIGPARLSNLMRIFVIAALLLSVMTAMTATFSFALCATLIMFWFATGLGDPRLLKFIKALFVLHVIVCLGMGLIWMLRIITSLPDLDVVYRVLFAAIFFATLFVVFRIHRRARELQSESAGRSIAVK